jgi:predicted nucleic acid-binding protein
MPFILDNSVVCGWFIENQATAYTEAMAERLGEDKAFVPQIWTLELANLLRTACLRQRMTAEVAQAILAQIVSLPIEIDSAPPRPSEVLALALRFGLSSYDAAYLELALRLQLPLASSDAPLRDAALASGVGVV